MGTELAEARVRQALRDRDLATGTWVMTRSAEACEIAAHSGFDFVLIDMEHGSFGIDGVVDMIRAVEVGGADPIVRVPSDSPVEIKKVLDAGARGVLIPGIRSAEQARRAVAAARFQPHGNRGACPCTRGAGHGQHPWASYRRWAHENVMVWLLVETADAVRDIEAVAAAGADALVLGPFDLSMDMGLDGDIDHPEVVAALEKVVDAAGTQRTDTAAVLFVDDPAQAAVQSQRWRQLGCRIVVASSDRWILAAGYQRMAESARGTTTAVAGG